MTPLHNTDIPHIHAPGNTATRPVTRASQTEAGIDTDNADTWSTNTVTLMSAFEISLVPSAIAQEKIPAAPAPSHPKQGTDQQHKPGGSSLPQPQLAGSQQASLHASLRDSLRPGTSAPAKTEVKVLLVGPQRSGKTTLASRLEGHHFTQDYSPTQTTRFFFTTLSFSPQQGSNGASTTDSLAQAPATSRPQRISLQLWDTSGMEASAVLSTNSNTATTTTSDTSSDTSNSSSSGGGGGGGRGDGGGGNDAVHAGHVAAGSSSTTSTHDDNDQENNNNNNDDDDDDDKEGEEKQRREKKARPAFAAERFDAALVVWDVSSTTAFSLDPSHVHKWVDLVQEHVGQPKPVVYLVLTHQDRVLSKTPSAASVGEGDGIGAVGEEDGAAGNVQHSVAGLSGEELKALGVARVFKVSSKLTLSMSFFEQQLLAALWHDCPISGTK